MRNDSIIGLLTVTDSLNAQLDELFANAEEDKSPKSTSRLLQAILCAKLNSTFHKINVHAAMTPIEVRNELEPALTQAHTMLSIHEKIIDRAESESRSLSQSLLGSEDLNDDSTSILHSSFNKPHVTVSTISDICHLSKFISYSKIKKNIIFIYNESVASFYEQLRCYKKQVAR